MSSSDVMATSSSSSSSSQGSAPGVLGKRIQTPGDLIIDSLEDLKGSDFKRFRNKLSDFSYGDKRPIPQGKLENADWITTKDVLIATYGEEGALDVTIDVLTQIGLMGPADDLKERRAQNAKLKKTTHDKTLSDISKEHRESEKFQRIKEYNSRMGEAVHLQERFINLLMIIGPQNKEGKEEEISSGRRHLQNMEKRPPTTIPALFDPDKYGFIPKIVVLEGPAGIGKTMTSKKIMLDWASGDLYKDQFDFVFYLSCREINTIPGEISLVELLSRSCRLSSDDLVSILEDPGSQRKLLIIVDGFDELRWTLEGKCKSCPDISMETHKEIILQSLFRRQVLPESSLIITTRSLAMEKLNTFIYDSRNVEIQGFTREDREEYVHQFYGNKEDADKVLRIIKEDDVVYTMCAVPITCWIVCTVMKQEIRKDSGSIRSHTTTSIYLLYLEVLLTHHSKTEPSVRRKQSCLKKLCALANQGVLTRQILFEKKDLERHGLSLDEVESVFLNENIFRWDVRAQTCYSFFHQSVQEFLAALYYGMDDGSGTSLPEICKGESLHRFGSDSSHLSLSVQFLFGLFNENPVKTFSEITGIPISIRAKPAILEWAKKDIIQAFPTPTILCLHETQDEDFIRNVTSSCSSLILKGSNTDHRSRSVGAGSSRSGENLKEQDSKKLNDFSNRAINGLTLCSKEEYQRICREENIYPMRPQNGRTRLALIICNDMFQDRTLKERNGAKCDVDGMEELLDGLGYEVVKKNNLTVQEMRDTMKDFAADEKHVTSDSTFLVFMSHGQRDVICGTDSQHSEAGTTNVLHVDEIFSTFNNINCRRLRDKPKIIIIQACRGNEHGGQWVSDSTCPPSSIVKDDAIEDDAMGDDAMKDDVKRMTLKETDFVCFCSSTPDTVSLRDPRRGSLFILSLIEHIKRDAHRLSIEDIFRNVKSSFKKGNLQMPTVERTTLEKKVYLFPGN